MTKKDIIALFYHFINTSDRILISTSSVTFLTHSVRQIQTFQLKLESSSVKRSGEKDMYIRRYNNTWIENHVMYKFFRSFFRYFFQIFFQVLFQIFQIFRYFFKMLFRAVNSVINNFSGSSIT